MVFSALSKPATAFSTLTVFYITFMFLPRLTPLGMFGDGLLYASISRNLAEGTGSWWAPFFSGGYWLAEVAPTAYWENPPLLFWMQSIFFRALGDHWWVEKLYALFLLLINCLLIARVWSLPWKNAAVPARSLEWLPIWFFYFIPIVVWGSPQNLIDSQLLMFCLAAVYCLLHAMCRDHQPGWWMIAGLACIFLGILTKGPVALYPVCLPALYGLVIDKSKLRFGLLTSVGLGVGAIACFGLLVGLHAPARYFFMQYWEQRLSVAIEGGRADGLRTGWGRLYIFWLLLRENSMLLPISVILLLVAWRQKIITRAWAYERKVALFFLLLALCATVPVMVSTRQAGMYLIPGLALFAMAAGYLHAPLVKHWLRVMSPKTGTILSGLMVIGIIAVIIHASLIAGQPGRERALLQDLPRIRALVPEGARVAVCDDVMDDFVYHVYLQRFHKIELTRNLADAGFHIGKGKCTATENNQVQEAGFSTIYEGEVIELSKQYMIRK